MKKPKICFHNSFFLIFRTIPQFKLSHEHKKRQQFSVCKPEEEKTDAEKSVRDSKILLFCQPYYHSSPYQKEN